jgi:hypothetical protein
MENSDFGDDIHLDVCQNIEVGLKNQYEIFPQMTDNLCIFGLENSVIAIKNNFGFAKNEKVSSEPLISGIIEWCVNIGIERIENANNLTLKEFVDQINKVRKSVILHSEYGTRGYSDFIKNYV